MRFRLAAILALPTFFILVLLGIVLVDSVSRLQQQQVYLDRLRDVGYLTEVAQRALKAGDPAIVEGDLARYREVYGVSASVLDASGETWASNGLRLDGEAESTLALAGRRSAPDRAVLPWQVRDLVVAEPVLDRGTVIGAVVSQSDVHHVSRAMWRSWGILAAAALLLALLAWLLADRISLWVLGPVRAFERGMAAMGSGRFESRIPHSVGPPELRGVTERFNEMAEKLERLVRKQREFVANANHELRNPLTTLSMRVDKLAMAPPEQGQQLADSVREEIVRVTHILDALLMLAAEDVSDSDPEPTDVPDLVCSRVDSWRLLAPGRAIELALPESGPGLAWAHPTVLQVALDAVIDNAMKYAPADRPVEIAVLDADGTLEIVVRDHGPGVPAEHLPRLTERSWRSPGHSGLQGSGLGLAITADLLASSGGGIEFSLPTDGGLQAVLRVPSCEEVAA